MNCASLKRIILNKKYPLSYKWYLHVRRLIYSETGKLEDKFTEKERLKIEKFWKNKILQAYDDCISKIPPKDATEKFYCLSMFPYPSGKLHMGHVRVYTICDVIARFQKLRGKQVIHPMGWDAFGLPAENAALQQNIDPAVWTHSNIKTMKQQLIDLACDFDWNRELATCDPAYYQWTQHLFLMLYREGLIYRRTAQVNWDPVDKTVLADEQINPDGTSWRSGAQVQKVDLKQWYIRTTAFSKSLYEGLDEVDKGLWRDVVSLQKNWIGVPSGVRVELPLVHQDKDKTNHTSHKDGDDFLSVYIDGSLNKLYNISHIILHPKHHLATKYKSLDGSAKLSVQALNPFTNLTTSLYTSDDLRLFGDFLDHYIGVPSFNQADKTFANEHNIPYKQNTSNEVSNEEIFTKAKELKIPLHVTSERARDWLISRQRYWGTPIPIVHCSNCGSVPVPEQDLPVELPPSFQPTSPSEVDEIASPLMRHEEWRVTTCPRCGGEGERETDTMDTFVDSSWYFLRYLDVNNRKEMCGKEALSHGMPVDLYIGGKEHATLHLYYARFISHFLHQQGLLPSKEPFKSLLTQGMVLGRSCRVGGRYLRPDEVQISPDGKGLVERETGKEVEEEWEKMSKSKHNGVDPQQVLTSHGTDSTRLCILSSVSPQSDRMWSEEAFLGVERWQKKLWSLVVRFLKARKDATNGAGGAIKGGSNNGGSGAEMSNTDVDEHIDFMRNSYLLQINFHLEKTFLINTAISRAQTLTSLLHKQPDEVLRHSKSFERSLLDLLIIISPMAPSYCSELWSSLADISLFNNHYEQACNIFEQHWPIVDVDFKLHMNVKVNNKDVFSIPLPMPHNHTDTQLTNKMAWKLVEEDDRYKELSAALSKGKDLSSLIKNKSLVNQGNSKVNFEIHIPESYNKHLMKILKNQKNSDKLGRSFS